MDNSGLTIRLSNSIKIPFVFNVIETQVCFEIVCVNSSILILKLTRIIDLEVSLYITQ